MNSELSNTLRGKKPAKEITPAQKRILNLLLLQPGGRRAAINYAYLVRKTYWEEYTINQQLFLARKITGHHTTHELIEWWALTRTSATTKETIQ